VAGCVQSYIPKYNLEYFSDVQRVVFHSWLATPQIVTSYLVIYMV
jgi:hypothetical protein